MSGNIAALRFMGGQGFAEASAIGATVRTNPLLPGRYWKDVPVSQLADFKAWLAQHRSSVTVRETREQRDQGSWPLEGDVVLVTYMVDVLSPVDWNGSGYFSSIGKTATIEDTSERPAPEPDITDRLTDALPSSGAIRWGIIAIIVAGGAFLVLRK